MTRSVRRACAILLLGGCAGAAADDAPVVDLSGCPELTPSPDDISETQMGADYPAPAGGEVTDGTYLLTRMEIYEPAAADAHVRRNRIDWADGRLVSTDISDGEDPRIQGGTVEVVGTTLAIALDCPSSASASIPFTATADELWLFDPSEPNLKVYTRQ